MENALSRLALDLSHDGISLHRLESGAWIMLDHIPLQVGTLKANMSRLRDLAEKSGGKVLVWMPVEQIQVQRVTTGGLGRPEQIRAARSAFAENGQTQAEAMEFHIGTMADDGTAPVAAIEASVLDEARDFIAQHGFEATGFSTRSRIEEFQGKPHFAAAEPKGRLASQALAAAAGIALAAGVGGLLWTGVGLFTRSSEPAFEVSSLLPPPGQEGAPLSPSAAPQVAPPDLSDAAAPVAPPETTTSFAAYYSFPDDQNAVQIEVPGAISADTPPELDQLPGPDTTVNPPRVAATLDPGQEGDTIPNIFTGNVQEDISPPQPPRPTLLGLTAPQISPPAGRARALSGLEIRIPATRTADFLIPAALPSIAQPEVTDEVAQPAEYFPVYLPVSQMSDTPGSAASVTAFADPTDTADPRPQVSTPAPLPAGQEIVASVTTDLSEDPLPSRFASVEALPLVPLLPDPASLETAADGLPTWFDTLPPPAPAPIESEPTETTPPVAVADPIEPAPDGTTRSDALAETAPAEAEQPALAATTPEPVATEPEQPQLVAEADSTETDPVTELAETIASLETPPADTGSEVEAALAEALADTPPEAPAAQAANTPDDATTQLAALDPETGAPADPEAGNLPAAPIDPRAPDAEILDPEAAAEATENKPGNEPGNEPAEEQVEVPEETPETEPEIRVIATAPPIQPPLRPAPPEESSEELAETQEAEAGEEEDVVAALIERALTDSASAPVTDDTRPRLRPANLVPEASEEPASDAPVRSRYALLYSERPRTRPQSFASQIVRVATSPPTDPVPATPQVQLPTSASVQQAATTRDAINLRNINLLGVAGSDGRRTAIIRMPNGKVVTVKTGDKFSGYQVAAIGRNAIRIRKNGRDTVLEIPQ